MHAISIPELKTFLEHVAIRSREPVFVWGQPGVGKSQAIEQLVADLHVWPDWLLKINPRLRKLACRGRLVDIRLSQYDSVDLRGFPGVVNDLTVWHAPSTLPFKGNPNFSEDELTVVFLDEANAASPAVSAVCYQLVNEHRIGEHELMDNVLVIAAGNREGDRGVTNRQPLPLANRFTHIEVGVDVDAWCDHAQQIGLPPVAIAFYQFRKDLLSTFDPSKPDKSFSTPRTAVKAWNYYADDRMPVNVKQAAMAGAIGNGPATEAWAFLDVWKDVLDYMPRILKEPETIELPTEASMTYAITVSISGNMNTENIRAYYKFLTRLTPEFVVLAFQLATKRDKTLYDTPTFTQYARTYKVIF
jgi:hypothetical protein